MLPDSPLEQSRVNNGANSMNVTIKDVAREAGVSPATVSRVLNESSRVSEKTAARVKKTIDKLDYEVNVSARTLRTKTSKLIGVIGASITNPFLMKVLEGAEKRARELNFSLLLGDSGQSQQKKLDYLQIMKQKDIDGIVVISSEWHNNFFLELEKSGIPTVVASGHVEKFSFPGVGIKNSLASREVIEYLQELGHKKIGIIRGPLKDRISSSRRMAGVRAAFQDLGLNFDSDLIFIGDYTFDSGYSGALELLKKNSDMTALFAFDDRMAIGAMRGAEALGQKVPEDISVVGFDDIDLSRFVNPRLSTVKQPSSTIGRDSINLLLNVIKNGPGAGIDNFKYVEHELLIRNSTRPAAD
ncbi:LacI family DNA-binding transcriptional regulator [Halarsenatibacter silvermanii]|nr:LacI family DNA-binding transcriptional regulator [Halarsenatibacter silvermanii]